MKTEDALALLQEHGMTGSDAVTALETWRSFPPHRRFIGEARVNRILVPVLIAQDIRSSPQHVTSAVAEHLAKMGWRKATGADLIEWDMKLNVGDFTPDKVGEHLALLGYYREDDGR